MEIILLVSVCLLSVLRPTKNGIPQSWNTVLYKRQAIETLNVDFLRRSKKFNIGARRQYGMQPRRIIGT
jgi:hypothetical protein